MTGQRGTGLPRREFLAAASLPLLSAAPSEIVIENGELRLVLGADGTARSLVEKSSGQECLAGGPKIPAFSMTQYSPLAGQLILLYPAGRKTFASRAVRRQGDLLLVAFEGVPHEVAIRLRIAPGYVGFTVEETRTEGQGWEGPDRLKTPIEELVLLQLPLRERAHFGEWLNVMWDGDVAVNLLGADPWCRIDSHRGNGYRLVRAAAQERVRTTGVSAALVVTRTAALLDRIAEVERDFHLPRGVESRRRKEYRYSYYWASGVTPQNIDRHIAYARQAGFPAMMISYRDFSRSAGHFPWRPEYPHGMDDLRAVVGKMKNAGLLPGVHIHYSKADKSDPYVSGKPDHRLNLARVFTLAAAIDRTATTIPVEEDPAGTTLDDRRRILKIGSELIEYGSYTASPPYRFEGCRRAQLGTTAGAYEAGLLFGVLDVDTWPIFVRFNQNTTIQREVGARLGEIYRSGFEFVYYDGAEDVHAPFWFTTAWAQWVVHQALHPAPLFAEGAQRSHFNWHILTRSNAYDVQQPEAIKDALRVYQEIQAPRTAKDFTAINFGWMGYRAPDAASIGTQPDMVEYLAGRAAAWDCPFSLHPRLADLDRHARTPDNLEAMRRWQEVVRRGWLNQAQKEELRRSHGDFTLLTGETGAFELVACEQIRGAGGGRRPLRAFTFERQGKTWVVYWHTEGRGVLHLPLAAARLWQDLAGKAVPVESSAAGLAIPAGGRMYLDGGGVPRDEIVRAFQTSNLA